MVERGDDALAAAGGVGVAAVEHRLGACVRRSGRLVRRGFAVVLSGGLEVRAIVTGGAGSGPEGGHAEGNGVTAR